MNFEFNAIPEMWSEVMLRSTIQGTIVVTIIFAIGMMFSKHIARNTQCWLWRLVFLKLILLMIFTKPLGIPILPAKMAQHSAASGTDHANTLHDFPRKIAITSKGDGSQEGKIPPSSSRAPIKRSRTIESSLVPDASPNNHNQQNTNQNSRFLPNVSSSTWMLLIWLLGIMLCIARLISTWAAARNLRRGYIAIGGSEIRQYARELCDRFDIATQPKLMVSNSIASPLLIGILKPTIVFPAKTLNSLDGDQLKLVIAHELAHLKRHDLWWSWIPTLAQVLFFFHPLVWLAHRRWLLIREMACDELVLSVTGQSARKYADALIKVSACMGKYKTNRIANYVVGSTCMVQTTFSLKERIQAMENFSSNRSNSWQAAALLSFAAMLAIVPWQLVEREAAAATPIAMNDELNLDFEEVNKDEFPTGWFVGGQGYKLSVSTGSHSGKYCGQIESVDDSGEPAFGTFTGRLDVKKYIGKRVRYSGYLKSDMDDGATAGLWIRADVGNDGFAFDNMNTRPVTGKSDWTKYSIVLDIPEDATNINFGFLISGKGVLWGDDLQFEIVGEIGEGPEVTDMMKQINLARQNDLNLDFEVQIAGRPIGWGGGGKGYELGSSPDAHRGESCGRIRSIGIPSQPSFGSFTNALSVEKYQGKRIRYSGYLKSDMEPQAWAGMWMRVDSKGKLPRFDNMNGRPVKGKTDWTEYSIVLDVPNDSHNINFGFLISGEGTLWGDDLKIEIIGDIGNGPAVTDMNK